MTTIEKNKETARTWLRLISENKVEQICELTAPAWKMHGGAPGMPDGPDGVRYLFSTFDHINQHWAVNQILGEGDKVVVRATNTCIQSSFLGIPAAGKTQVFTCTFIFHIVDGLMQETWRNADDLGRLLQIGARLLPPEV